MLGAAWFTLETEDHQDCSPDGLELGHTWPFWENGQKSRKFHGPPRGQCWSREGRRQRRSNWLGVQICLFFLNPPSLSMRTRAQPLSLTVLTRGEVGGLATHEEPAFLPSWPGHCTIQERPAVRQRIGLREANSPFPFEQGPVPAPVTPPQPIHWRLLGHRGTAQGQAGLLF